MRGYSAAKPHSKADAERSCCPYLGSARSSESIGVHVQVRLKDHLEKV